MIKAGDASPSIKISEPMMMSARSAQSLGISDRAPEKK